MMADEMKTEAKGVTLFRMSPGFFALALLLKYGILTIYGIHGAIVSVPSFVSVGGEIFATVWASIVAILSLTSFLAVIRTWITGKPAYEKWATSGFILGFLTYSVVLVVRGIQLGNWEGISLAWIPVALVALPTFRYYQLVWTKAQGESHE